MATTYKRKRYSDKAQALAIYRPPTFKKRRVYTPKPARYIRPTGEVKFFDFNFNSAPVPTAGAVKNSFLTIAQGVDESERIGRKIRVIGVAWHLKISLPALAGGAAPNPGDSARVILYIDKQCNGATATVGDVLETADIRSFRNLANIGRFKLLCDKIFTLNYSGAAYKATTADFWQSYVDSQQRLFFKIKDLPIEYNSTTGAVSEIRSNNIGAIIISEAADIDMNSYVRVRYTDN